MNKNVLIALVVVGLAALAGGVFFVVNKDDDADTQQQTETQEENNPFGEMEEEYAEDEEETAPSTGSFKTGSEFCAYLSLEEAKDALGVSNLIQSESEGKDSCGYVAFDPVISMAYGIAENNASEAEYRTAMGFLGSEIEEVNISGMDYSLWLNSVGQLHMSKNGKVLIVTILAGDDVNATKDTAINIANTVLENMD